MKKIFFLTFVLTYISFNLKAQEKPIFKGTTYEDNGGMGSDQIDVWKYKGYVFKTITPGIARPIVTTNLFKMVNGKLVQIKNNELFGSNVFSVIELINSKLEKEFATQKKEDPLCFKEFYPVGINELSISIDNDYMYFEVIWDTSYLIDSDSECLYSSSTAMVSISEITQFMKP
jgi:hypothetical protein